MALKHEKIVVLVAMPSARHSTAMAVNAGLLTIYDMVKAVDRGMVISDIRLLEKRGGKSGDFAASAKTAKRKNKKL